MDIRFDRYYDNDELGLVLRHLVDSHPGLARLETLGLSHEGRPIPLLVLTNASTGADTDKPACWLSGNIHAIEVAGSMACLHAAWTLLVGHGRDEQLTRLLDRTTFYIAPRLSPDGADRVFRTPRDLVLSSTRPYPDGLSSPGLQTGDVDGDGRVLDMRVPDPTGSYKTCDLDPRLMVRRGPDEEGGDYYLLLPEGRVPDYDGHRIAVAGSRSRLNFNRNFPTDWAPDPVEPGAGPFPLSEPETLAAADFIAAHRNIVSAMDYHTYSGIHLRPFGGRDDLQIPQDDLEIWQAMGRRATELTGYPAVSIWHGFRYSPTRGMAGGFLDWMYEQRGIFGWTTELWDMCREAGVLREDIIGWHHDHPVEDELAMLRWSDEKLEGRAFVPWYHFDHPELGPVELGGWDRMFTWNNPPEQMLQAELERNTPFVHFLAALAPRLEVRSLTARPLGGSTWSVTLVVDNAGYLPSYGSRKAIDAGAAGPVTAELTTHPVLDGPARRELGHLAGRSGNAQFAGIAPVTPTDHRGAVTWLVQAPAGARIGLDVVGGRAGRLQLSVELTAPA